MFVKTIFFKNKELEFDPIWSNLIQTDPTWSKLTQFDLEVPPF